MRLLLVLITATCYLVGCSKWVATNYQTLADELRDGDKKVRVTDKTGTVTEIEATLASPDEIYGHVKDKPYLTSVSLTGVEQIEIRQSDTGATIVLIVGAVMLVGGVLYTASESFNDIGTGFP